MPSMTSFEFGQIMLVRFPFVFTAEKTIVRKTLGQLSQKDQEGLRTVIG